GYRRRPVQLDCRDPGKNGMPVQESRFGNSDPVGIGHRSYSCVIKSVHDDGVMVFVAEQTILYGDTPAAEQLDDRITGFRAGGPVAGTVDFNTGNHDQGIPSPVQEFVYRT